MKTVSLEELERWVGVATRNLEDACAARWPVGTSVSFVYSSRQRTPSTGIVRSWRGGEVNIEKDTLNRRGYHGHKWRHWTQLR